MTITYNYHQFRVLCDDYEFLYPEDFTKDIGYMEVRNCLAKEEVISITSSWTNKLGHLKEIVYTTTNNKIITIDCSKSKFNSYLLETLERLEHFIKI